MLYLFQRIIHGGDFTELFPDFTELFNTGILD